MKTSEKMILANASNPDGQRIQDNPVLASAESHTNAEFVNNSYQAIFGQAPTNEVALHYTHQLE